MRSNGSARCVQGNSKCLILSHVEIKRTRTSPRPVIPSPVLAHTSPEPVLPKIYGPSISLVASFLDYNLNLSSPSPFSGSNPRCPVLSFFGIFQWQELLICTLHSDLFIIPLSHLALHLNRGGHTVCHFLRCRDREGRARTGRISLHNTCWFLTTPALLYIVRCLTSASGHVTDLTGGHRVLGS